MSTAPIFDYRGEYDENLPLPEHLTLAQYRRVFFRPNAHFIDGQIIARSLGDRTHSHTIGFLIGELHSACEALDFHCGICLRLQVSSTRIRVCDFVILSPDAPYEPVPCTPPLLCIETLAPGQTPGQELDTLADYLTMGVQNIWLIDPIRRKAHTFDAAGLHDADPTHLAIPGTPIHLDLTEAFAAID